MYLLYTDIFYTQSLHSLPKSTDNPHASCWLLRSIFFSHFSRGRWSDECFPLFSSLVPLSNTVMLATIQYYVSHPMPWSFLTQLRWIRTSVFKLQQGLEGIEAQMYMAIWGPPGLKSTFVSPRVLGWNPMQCFQVAKGGRVVTKKGNTELALSR